MIISYKQNGKTHKVDTTNPIDISIPLKFNGEQPNAYGVEIAKSEPCRAGELVGDTRLGGSCNFEQYKFIPHCNGTHTECIEHITNERISVRNCLKDTLIPATLISIKPEKAVRSNETYPFEFDSNDLLITHKLLERNICDSGNSALIVRTLPNSKNKLKMEYGEYIPPFFSNEAMNFLVECGFKHLLVDLPSIDRIFDDGKLSNHRKFWNIDDEKFDLNKDSEINNTITELIYVPGEIVDDDYLLNLQITQFESDVSPSRPLLFRQEKTAKT